MKKWLIRLMIIFIPLLVWIIHFLVTPLNINKADLAIEIEPGSSLKAIAFQLVDEKILNEPWRFIILTQVPYYLKCPRGSQNWPIVNRV